VSNISEGVYESWRQLGWYPGREIDVAQWERELRDDGFEVHSAGLAFLREFGGLRCSSSGLGYTKTIEPFDLDPMLCMGESDRFNEWGRILERSFCPVGELDDGRFFLAVDASSCLFLVSDWVASFGPGAEAMRGLLEGAAPKTVHDGFD